MWSHLKRPEVFHLTDILEPVLVGSGTVQCGGLAEPGTVQRGGLTELGAVQRGGSRNPRSGRM